MNGKFPSQLFSDELGKRGGLARPFDIIENVFRIVMGPPVRPSKSKKATKSDKALNAQIAAIKKQFSTNTSARITRITKAAVAQYKKDNAGALPKKSILQDLEAGLSLRFTQVIQKDAERALRARLREMGSSVEGDYAALEDRYARAIARAAIARKASKSTSVTKTGFYLSLIHI